MMDMIYKAILTIIMVVFVAATGSSIATTQQTLNNVNSYFDDVTTTIAESHYSEQVINDCIAEAATNGYTLTVNVIEDTSANGPGKMLYAKAEMQYKYQINILGVSETKTKHKII